MQMLSAACSATGPSQQPHYWGTFDRAGRRKGTVRKIYWNQLIKSMSTTTTVVVDYANNNHNSSPEAEEEVEEEEVGQECPLGTDL